MIYHKAEHFLHVDTLSQDYSIRIRLHFTEDWIVYPCLLLYLKFITAVQSQNAPLQVRLIVVDRNTGKVVETKYMSTDTFFCFHHANAYEDKGN